MRDDHGICTSAHLLWLLVRFFFPPRQGCYWCFSLFALLGGCKQSPAHMQLVQCSQIIKSHLSLQCIPEASMLPSVLLRTGNWTLRWDGWVYSQVLSSLLQKERWRHLKKSLQLCRLLFPILSSILCKVIKVSSTSIFLFGSSLPYGPLKSCRWRKLVFWLAWRIGTISSFLRVSPCDKAFLP